jgi:20S proteasome alpha/beta subunit
VFVCLSELTQKIKEFCERRVFLYPQKTKKMEVKNTLKMKDNNIYLPKRQRGCMTLIIGARCKDGVVLIGDKKVTEGNTSIEQEKITILPFGVAISGAGYTDFFDKFGIKLKNYMNQRVLEIDNLKKERKIPKETGLYDYIDDFITDCETILVKLREDYREVEPQLHLLISLRNDNKSELHFINISDGVDSIRKTFMTIGSGSPYANFFLRELWSQDLTMEEMAKIGTFIIDYVSKKNLDEAVGKGVQIVKIPDLVVDMKEGEGDIQEIIIKDKAKIDGIIEEFHKRIRELKKDLI